MRLPFVVLAIALALVLTPAASAATPSFTVSSTIPTGDSPVMPVAGDFNDDGNPDLAVSYCGGECPPAFVAPFGAVDVTLNTALGQFPPPLGLTTAGFIGPTGLVSGDLNRDGDADLVAADPGEPNVRSLLGNGSGGFQATGSIPPSLQEPTMVALADFDANGKVDVAYSAETGAQGLFFLEGGGDGTFTPHAPTGLLPGAQLASLSVA